MEKPSVTIQHKEGYAASGAFFGAALLMFVLNTVMPSAQHDEQILGYAIVAMTAVMGAFFLLWARCSETLDEDGITLRRLSKVKRYGWNEIGSVSIQPPQGKDLPKLQFRNTDGRHIAYIDYTKRALACVHVYYGNPDLSKWCKPPTIF